MNDVRVVFAKWGGRAHWEFDGQRLGEDEHGVWIGAPAGTRVTRPGASYVCPQEQVSLIPRGAGFAATFYAWSRDASCEVYVDITTPPTWDGDTVRMVDLDLDVLKGWSGQIWVDDEDEFAAHRARFGYPANVVDLAVRTCDQVRREVEAGTAPYDGVVSRRWMERFATEYP